jgi:hypothetical protein
MNGGTIRGTALSMDGIAHPWMERFYEWIRTNLILRLITSFYVVSFEHFHDLALQSRS